MRRNLAKKYKKSDVKAFKYLFEIYFEPLKAYAILFVKRVDIAEEIVQDIFIKIGESHSEINIRTSLKSYLFRSVHNTSINYIKSKVSRNDSITNSLENEALHFEVLC